MSVLGRTNTEKRVTRQIERRLSHVFREPREFRLAGALFGLAQKDAARARAKEAKQSLQRVRPVGLGFATEDTYGPDNNWNVIQSLNSISYQDYYKGQQTY